MAAVKNVLGKQNLEARETLHMVVFLFVQVSPSCNDYLYINVPMHINSLLCYLPPIYGEGGPLQPTK